MYPSVIGFELDTEDACLVKILEAFLRLAGKHVLGISMKSTISSVCNLVKQENYMIIISVIWNYVWLLEYIHFQNGLN